MADSGEIATTRLLIIGAGPYGLSLARYAEHHGLDYRIVGKTMGFWKDHMPAGMVLRSGLDWHLDPMRRLTMPAWLAQRGSDQESAMPISLSDYLDYTTWFQDQAGVAVEDQLVIAIDRLPGGSFQATCMDGTKIDVHHIAVAAGFQFFPWIPDTLTRSLPPDRLSHTRDFVDFSDVAGKRYLIVGGRQSAYEWAALLADAGAAQVDMVHRHPSPAFAEADWDWVLPIMKNMIDEPTWYRALTEQQQRDVSDRLWSEGRMKVEPWLSARLDPNVIRVHPGVLPERVDIRSGGSLQIGLTDGDAVRVDHVIAATGYVPDVDRVPFLSGNLDIARQGALPVLDEHFQTSVPGLYLTSMLATRSFGPFFAFTVGARISAEIIGRHLLESV